MGSIEFQSNVPSLLRVAANEDQFGEHRSLGVSQITFKVTPNDSNGIFIIENTFHEKGGPAKHLHYDQDEWFYALEGEFLLEVGNEQVKMKPGESILAPRKIPHVWAYPVSTVSLLSAPLQLMQTVGWLFRTQDTLSLS